MADVRNKHTKAKIGQKEHTNIREEDERKN